MEIGIILLKMYKFALSKCFMLKSNMQCSSRYDTHHNADKTRFSKIPLYIYQQGYFEIVNKGFGSCYLIQDILFAIYAILMFIDLAIICVLMLKIS